MKTFTATIQFTAINALEAKLAFEMMRETFCNNEPIKEIRSSLIDSNFNQVSMVNCPEVR